MSSYFHSVFLNATRPFRKPTEKEKQREAEQKRKQNSRRARIRNGYTSLSIITHDRSPSRRSSRSRGGRRTKHRSRK
jgi:hypothetical protein